LRQQEPGNEPEISLELAPPAGASQGVPAWNLTAWNKRILKDWIGLCRDTPQEATRCFDWLSRDAMKPIPRRCYALKGHQYAGIWSYEIGSGNRVYYKPFKDTKAAVVYYAGNHPPQGIPLPPKGL